MFGHLLFCHPVLDCTDDRNRFLGRKILDRKDPHGGISQPWDVSCRDLVYCISFRCFRHGVTVPQFWSVTLGCANSALRKLESEEVEVRFPLPSAGRVEKGVTERGVFAFACQCSETGRIRFRRARFQTLSSVSFLSSGERAR